MFTLRGTMGATPTDGEKATAFMEQLQRVCQDSGIHLPAEVALSLVLAILKVGAGFPGGSGALIRALPTMSLGAIEELLPEPFSALSDAESKRVLRDAMTTAAQLLQQTPFGGGGGEPRGAAGPAAGPPAQAGGGFGLRTLTPNTPGTILGGGSQSGMGGSPWGPSAYGGGGKSEAEEQGKSIIRGKSGEKSLGDLDDIIWVTSDGSGFGERIAIMQHLLRIMSKECIEELFGHALRFDVDRVMRILEMW